MTPPPVPARRPSRRRRPQGGLGAPAGLQAPGGRLRRASASGLLIAGLVMGGLLPAGCGGPDSGAASEGSEPRAIEPAPLNPAAPAQEQAALAACAPVSTTGYCGVSFGMRAADARLAFPVALEADSGADGAGGADPNRCYEMFAAEPVQGVSFMVEGGLVQRVDFLTDAPRTAEGFGVGSSAAEIKARFGSAASEAPNKYEPEVTDLTVLAGGAKYIFDIADGRVRSWRAGRPPAVDYTEHCG